MNLFEIDTQIRSLLDAAIDPETGEVLEPELLKELDELEVAREHKIESTALYIKSQRAFANAIAGEIASLNKRRQTALKHADGAERYLATVLDGEKFNSPRVGIGWKKTQAVKVTDLSKIPKRYLRIKDPEPDKVEIGKILKSGGKVDGAELITNTNIVLK